MQLDTLPCSYAPICFFSSMRLIVSCGRTSFQEFGVDGMLLWVIQSVMLERERAWFGLPADSQTCSHLDVCRVSGSELLWIEFLCAAKLQSYTEQPTAIFAAECEVAGMRISTTKSEGIGSQLE